MTHQNSMTDPTREELIAFLTPWVTDDDFDELEIAIYWFANHWHDGQSSNLYSVLCTSPYEPGSMARLENETSMVRFLYDELTALIGE
jgi:hypothetical protein